MPCSIVRNSVWRFACANACVPLAEEDKPQGGDGVDEDPEARYEQLPGGHADGLLGRLILGQFLQFRRMRIARFHVVNETLGGGALFGSYAGVSKGAVQRVSMAAYPCRRAVERATVRRGAKCEGTAITPACSSSSEEGALRKTYQAGAERGILDTRRLGCDAKRVRLVSLAI